MPRRSYTANANHLFHSACRSGHSTLSGLLRHVPLAALLLQHPTGAVGLVLLPRLNATVMITAPQAETNDRSA